MKIGVTVVVMKTDVIVTPNKFDRSDFSKPRRERVHSSRKESLPENEMERFRIEVGSKHDVQPGNIVGAIANEAGIDAQYIGRISIFEDHSLVDLPEGMPKEIFKSLRKVWVSGQQLQIAKVDKQSTFEKFGKREKKPNRSANTDKPAKRSSLKEFKKRTSDKTRSR